MQKVFVTGANGLLGTNVVLMLLDRGYEVVALVRRERNFEIPGLKNLLFIEGDLVDIDKLRTAIKSCEIVVHIAADTSQSHLKIEDYYSSNVLGTKNIIEACIQNNVKKLVYVGTANTYGFGTKSDPGNEDMPMKYPFIKCYYAVSKKQAQDIIDNAASRINITSISPTFMLGAHDTKPSSGRLILAVLNKRLVFYPSGGKNFVHVKDVAESIIRAFAITESGRKYIIANENITYKDFYKRVIAINKQKTTLIPIPDFILLSIGYFGDFFRLLKIKTDVSSVNGKKLLVRNFYENLKAKNDLKMKFIPVDEAITDSISYLIQKSKKEIKSQ